MPITPDEKAALLAQAEATTAALAAVTTSNNETIALIEAIVPDVTPPPTDYTGGLTQPAGFSTLAFSDYFEGPTLDTTKWYPGMADLVGGLRPWQNKGQLKSPFTAVGNAGGYNAECDTPAQ